MLIGYARVSTEDQDLTLQIEALEAAGCEHIYKDKRSGKTLKNRPGWRKAMMDLRDGDTLIIWKMDRLGRNTVEVLSTLDHFKREGIKVRSLTEGFDADTPIGRMVISILASVSQYEREVLGERTSAGMAVSGKVHGGIPKFADPKVWRAAMDALAAWENDPEVEGKPIPNRWWAREVRERSGKPCVTSTVKNNRDILLTKRYPDDYRVRWEQAQAEKKERAQSAREGKRKGDSR
ncbi:MAG: recombinase family protein [Pseudomonadota bacterium]